MKKQISSSLFGLAMLIGAFVIIGRVAGWWQGDLDGWWTVFLIVPGIAGLISNGFNWWFTGLTVAGVWLLAEEQNWLAGIPSKEILYIVLLLFFGLGLILSPLRNKSKHIGSTPAPIDNSVLSAEEYPKNTTVFSGSDISCTGTVKGAKLNAVFGGIDIDFSNALVMEGSVINATAVFGGIEIKTGGKFRVVLKGFPLFGGVSDNSKGKNDPNLPIVYINYNAVFGGIDIV